MRDTILFLHEQLAHRFCLSSNKYILDIGWQPLTKNICVRSLLVLFAAFLHGCSDSASLNAEAPLSDLTQSVSPQPTLSLVNSGEVNTSDPNNFNIATARYWNSRTATDAAVSARISSIATDESIKVDSFELLMSDEITLKAIVARPDRDGKFPIVVIPSSWALNYIEYAAQAKQMAKRGYVAVSYTSRGFWDAGGVVGVADRRTVQDVSEIIDWTAATQQGDVQHVAAGGISYGAGIALLASARDPRIDAVFSLSGWTDIAESFFYNETVSKQASLLLGSLAALTGRFSQELTQILEEAAANDISDDTLNRLIPERSPYYELSALNNHLPAVLQISGWNDGLFPPSQFFKFYSEYKGRYRLILTAGDHTTHELPGLAGLPNESWQETMDWLDEHLQGRPVAVKDGPIKLYTNNTKKVITVADPGNLPVTWRQYQLGPQLRQGLLQPQIGRLSDEPKNEGWQLTLSRGLPTSATTGFALVTGLLQDWFQAAPIANTNLLARQGAIVWRGEKTLKSSFIVGSPVVQLQLVPSQLDSTIMVYLYDEAENGIAKLITHAPFSRRDLVVGQPLQVEMELLAISYELPEGHRLAVAIDSADSRYSSLTNFGEKIDLLATTDQPALLKVPFLNR